MPPCSHRLTISATCCHKPERLRLAVEIAEGEVRLGLADRRDGSTLTPFMGERSSISPPLHTALPATLWPPARTASGRSCVRAKPHSCSRPKSSPPVKGTCQQHGRIRCWCPRLGRRGLA